MAFDRFKFGGKVKEADLKRVEDNIDLMEKSRDAFRRYLARILKSKMYLDNIDEDADTMDTLIGRIDDLGSKWILEDNKKVAFPSGCSWTDVRDDMYMDSIVVYCRNTGTADDYGTINIKGRFLEIVRDPRLVITNKSRTLETIEDRYFDYTIDASSMSGIAEADGGAYFTIYFDPDSHTNGVELKIDGDCVEWVCFNTTFPTLLDLGNHTAKRVENIACGPVIMRIKDNDTLQQVVGVRFRTDSQIIAFENCTALKVFDNVDVSYPNPYYRFEGCTSMVHAPRIVTSNCSRLDKLFKGCTSLTDIPELDMSSCKNAREMFMGPIGLTTATVNGKLKNANALEIAERMFANTNIDVEITSFETMKDADSMYENNVIPSGDMSAMIFNGGGTASAPAIVSVKDMFAFDPAKASGEDKLTSVGAITTNNCSLEADGLYKGRTKLTTANLGLSAATKIHSANSMFEGCTGLTTLPVADYSGCVRYSNMYKGCSNIVDNSNITMEFGSLEWSAAYPASEAIFDGCSKITGTLTIDNMCKPYDFWLTSGGCPTAEAPKFTAVTFNNMTEDVAGCKIAVHNQNMNAAALNAMFNSLADVTAKNTERGVQSYIIIQGNPGAATCDTTIATNKGWTIADLTDLMVKLATVVITDTGFSSMSISSTDDNPVPYCRATFEYGKSNELLCKSRKYTVPTEREAECAGLGELYEVDIYGWDDFTSIEFVKHDSRGNIIENPNMIYCDYLKLTNKCTSLSLLFNSCINIKYIDTSNWDVSNVIYMTSTFYNCSSLTTPPDVSGWNVSKVTNMNSMFSDCKSLTTPPDVSKWNVSNVTNMNSMFKNCSSLTTIDTSSWNVSSVTNMNNMFNSCKSLTTIDTSSWNVSSVTIMSGMFQNCSSLTTLNTSSWKVSSVTNMNNMFQNCGKLTTLDTSSWKVSSVTNMNNMFSSCKSLTTIDTSSWNVSNVTTMNSMFYNCSSLTTLDTSSWNVSSVTNMGSMFGRCSSLTTLNTSSWNVSKVTNMNSVFEFCSSLTTLDTSKWNVSSVTNMSGMFRSCSSLITLDTSSWNVSSVTKMGFIFDGCSSLTTLDTSSWNVSNVTVMGYMFGSCNKLTTLNLSNWNVSKVISMDYMFSSCKSLTTLNLSNWNASVANNLTNMFISCSALTRSGITMPTDQNTLTKITEALNAANIPA